MKRSTILISALFFSLGIVFTGCTDNKAKATTSKNPCSWNAGTTGIAHVACSSSGLCIACTYVDPDNIETTLECRSFYPNDCFR